MITKYNHREYCNVVQSSVWPMRFAGEELKFMYDVKVQPRFAVKSSIRRPLPASIDATVALLAEAEYLADRSLGTVLYLALKMGRPIFLEGEAGVGKTEIAKVLSSTLGRRLIRLQCYEGLDVAAAV
jgi:hypothetical protein